MVRNWDRFTQKLGNWVVTGWSVTMVLLPWTHAGVGFLALADIFLRMAKNEKHARSISGCGVKAGRGSEIILTVSLRATKGIVEALRASTRQI